MAVKMAMVLNLAVLALLLAAVSATSRSSLDLFDLLASNNPEALRLVKHNKPTITKDCCNECMCTRSYPPQCTCRDVFIGTERCGNCETCICTLSIPPQCRCVDVKDYCLPKCKSTTTGSAEAHVDAEFASSD